MVGARTVIPTRSDRCRYVVAPCDALAISRQREPAAANGVEHDLRSACGATNRAAAWRPNSLNQVLAMTIPLPALDGANRPGRSNCRPGIYQRDLPALPECRECRL